MPRADAAGPSRTALAAAASAAVFCNDAAYDPALGESGRSGDTVEIALLVLAVKAGISPATARAEGPRIGEIPFAAERRFSATLNLHADGPRLHAKGATGKLLPLCGNAGEQAQAAAEDMAADGYRVLAIAAKPVDADRSFASSDIEEELNGLTLLALVGFIDPLRPEAAEAVAACRRAGVSVRMVTGDHPVTALAIARQLHLADHMDEVVTGQRDHRA